MHSVTTSDQHRKTSKIAGPVLVIGGAGYIGSILVRKLLNRGVRVRILDNLLYGDSAIRDLYGHSHLHVVVGDCRHLQSVVAAARSVSSIVHLAAIVGDGACHQDPDAAMEINYAATRMITEVAKGNRVKRFVFASSCSVYGVSEEAASEESPVNPVSLYAKTKLYSEKAVLEAQSVGFHPTILRLATVFGNSYRPRFDLAVNFMTARAISEGVVTVYNGDSWRPFIHVQDVADGICQVLSAPVAAVSGQIFNLGDVQNNYTLTTVAEKVCQICKAGSFEQSQNGDRRNYRVLFDKISRTLQFRRTFTVEDGIAEIKEALERKLVDDYRDVRYHNQQFLRVSDHSRAANETGRRLMAAFQPPEGWSVFRADLAQAMGR